MPGVLTERDELRKAALALLAALLLHLLVLIAIVAYLDWLQRPAPTPQQKAAESIELVLVAPPEPVMERPKMIIAPEHAPDAGSVDRPAFEADRTTRAASERPATGTASVPSQDGRAQSVVEMQTRDYTEGELDRPARPAVPLAAAAPTPMSQATPQEIARPGDFALLAPTPKPTPVPTPSQVPAPATLASRPAYQPHNRATQLDGSIDNRGRSSVDAVATPLGQFRKKIADAIGARWHHYTRSRMDLIRIGTARVKFQIMEDGSVENVRLIHNTSNEVGGTCSVQAIMEAELPPIPPDIASTLEGRRLEIEYTFTIY